MVYPYHQSVCLRYSIYESQEGDSIAKGEGYAIASQVGVAPKFVSDYESEFYIRLTVKDELRVVEKIGQLCKKHRVPLNQLSRTAAASRANDTLMLTTKSCALADVETMLATLRTEKFVTGTPLIMPIIK